MHEAAAKSFIPRTWYLERLLPIKTPMAQSTNYHSQENRTRIIHVILRDWQDLRERHPRDDVNEVAECEDVDGNPKHAELEGSVRRWWTAELAD